MSGPVDFLGKPITEHCVVIYPVRSGSAMWLQKMKVSQVIPVGSVYQLKVYDPTSTQMRSHRIKNLHTCVVVERPE
jgi:hypothetical protein